MKLEDFPGMKWAEAEAALKDNLALMALSDDKKTRECALAIRDQGLESGAAILCATLFLKENGVERTMRRGISIYKEVLDELREQGRDISWTEDRINEVESWLCWMRAKGPRKDGDDQWPIKFPFRNRDKKAGLANIMFWLSLSELDTGQNTDRIVAMIMGNFLKDGLERKRNDRTRKTARTRTKNRTREKVAC